MTVLEKIRRCVLLVWDFQEFYDEEDIEDFCRNELHTYPQNKEIMEYFKHIETLEKENVELKEQLYAFDEEREKLRKENAELEKENTELKADNAEWEKASDKWKNVYELTNNQLIKAKEIIKLLSWDIRNRSYEPIKDLEKAEQFIKDLEK